MDGQLEPQSVHSCPPQSSPMAQSGGELLLLLLLPHSWPKEDNTESRSATSTVASPLVSVPSDPEPP